MRSGTDLPPGRLLARRHRPVLNGTTPTPFPRGLIVLLSTAGLVVTVAGMQAVSGLLGPVFLALMLTVTVSPIATGLRRHGTPVWLAMLATVTSVYLLLIGLGAAMAISVARLVELMPTYADQLSGLRADLEATLNSAGISDAQIAQGLDRVTDPGTVADVIGFVFGGVTSALSNAFFLLAVLLFMCLDAVGFPARLGQAATQRPAVVGALRSFAGGTRRYLWVSTVFGLIVAVVDTVMLWWLDVPLPLLWGLLAFITNYIPNIGFVIGLIPPALLALLEGGPQQMLIVVALYCVVNFVIQSVIQPKIVGDAVGLSATVSFLSLVFWAWVLGPLGALLAIPLSLLAKGLLVDIDPATRWLNPLLGSGEPAAAQSDSSKTR